MRDQAEGLRKMAEIHKSSPAKSTGQARVICVTSGKGGVGKTNVSVNLALGLAQMGLRVALLDADLGLANVDIVLGLTPRYTLADVLRGQRRIEDIAMDGPLGLKVIAGGNGVYDLANLRQYELDLFAQSLETLDEEFDFILVDTGGGLNRNVLSFVLAVDEILIVTTPEPTAITDAYGMIKVISQKNPDSSIKIAVNMVRNADDGQMVWKRLNTVAGRFLQTNVDFAGAVDYDQNVSRSVTDQRPFLLAYPHSAASRCLQSMAEDLAGIGQAAPQVKAASGIRRLFDKVHRLLQT